MGNFNGGAHADIQRRWRGPIKFGIDDGAAQLDPNSPTDATVADLTAKPQANQDEHNPSADRIPDLETTVWRVQALLTGHKKEQDSDYHLAIRDPNTGEEMVAEIPDPRLLEQDDRFYQQISAARATAREALHLPPEPPDAVEQEMAALSLVAAQATLSLIADPDRQVTITGIGFYDFTHGQRGAAPNGAELHPVLSIEFT